MGIPLSESFLKLAPMVGSCCLIKSCLTDFSKLSRGSLAVKVTNVFLGTVYAPSADMKLSGGGSFNLDYQGAIAVNNIQMNGHFNFHFDENLKKKGPSRGYQITSWNEI